ncbi:hypothetical protein KR026_004254, partial [Drosophila bipectinata]
LEMAIATRVSKFAEAKGTLSVRQHGFRKGRSTVEAIKAVTDTAEAAIAKTRWKWGEKEYCAMVTLDIRNAFNSANWTLIQRPSFLAGTPRYLQLILSSYLSDNTLLYDTDEGPKSYKVTAGVPQGSVLGPLLWNIMYDKVLRIQLPTGCETASIPSLPSLFADDTDLHKYLGVMLDNRMSYGAHVEYSTIKAARIQGALSRMLPNVGGPTEGRRRLLASVVTAPIWAASVRRQQGLKKKLGALYRLAALRVISGFRT